MSPDPYDTDPVTERRLADAFHALATTEVPASAPRPQHAPRPAAARGFRSRRWQLGGGLLLAAAAATVVALVVGGEVDDARTPRIAPPATGPVSPTGTVAPVSTPTPSGRTCTGTAPTGTTSTTAAATSPSRVTVSTSAATGTSAGSAGRPVVCSADDTSVEVTGGNGGDGHFATVVVLTNTSDTACVTSGYPGVALLDASGQQVTQAARTGDGYFGGPPGGVAVELTLQPGEQASAGLEGLTSDPGTGAACPGTTALLVTAPDDTRSTTVAHPLTICGDVEIHPLVAGAGGGMA